MARDSGGTYSLPSGNPVVTGTAISSTTHNDTLADIKTELTDSLSRSNKGAMLAQFQAYSGTVNVPGIGWAADTDTGFYHISAGSFGVAINGTNLLTFSAGAMTLAGTLVRMIWNETDADANEKAWEWRASAGTFSLIADTDLFVGTTTPIAIARTGTTIDSITFNGTTIALTGNGTVSGTFTVGGQLIVNSASGLVVSGTEGVFYLRETDAAADEQYWRMVASGGDFYLQTRTDALGAGVNALRINRTGTAVDLITLTGTTIALAGNATVSGDLAVTGDVSGDNVDATTAMTIGGAAVPVQTSGSFTVTFASASSGGTTYGTGTAYWTKNGKLVTLTFPVTSKFAAISGADYFFVRGFPAAIKSACAIMQTISVPLEDENTYLTGLMEIFSGSVDYARIYAASGTYGFSGTVCGLYSGATVTFRVAD